MVKGDEEIDPAAMVKPKNHKQSILKLSQRSTFEDEEMAASHP